MKKKLFILFYFIYLLSDAQPGKEAWHWRFGTRCSMDFNTGSPITGTCNTYFTEATATVSDENTGQLLFYSEGTHVYNRTGAVMSNGYGISGYAWTSQGALIVPKPNKKEYYLIHVSNSCIRYSRIDMNLYSGLGGVTAEKNKLLSGMNPCNKLTAVRHCNGIDYWIITHPYNTNSFYVYKVDSSGLDTVPVISTVGTLIKEPGTGTAWERGYIKTSPNGKKLALAESDSLSFLEIYDFDNLNGIVSNPITINFPSNGIVMTSVYSGSRGPYAVSFSPDNTKLYTSLIRIPSALYQFDLSGGTPASVIASKSLIATLDSSQTLQFCALQMAPNGKIYTSIDYTDTLAVINNPNNPGVACNFQRHGPIFQPSHHTGMGLPNFIDGNYAGVQINLPDIKQCSSKSDTLDAGSGFVNYFWSTGASTQTITINSPGKYWVTVTNDQGCTRTDTMEAIFIESGKKIISACVMDTVNTMQSSALTYNWSDGSVTPAKTFSVSGTFWEDISFIGGCAVRDSFVITINPLPVVNLGRDTSFCKGDLTLNAFNPSSTYQWNTGETSPSITANTAGTYFVKVNMNNCFAYDTLIVKQELSLFNFQMPNIVTPNDDKVNDVVDFSKYQFSSLQIQIFNRWGQEIFKSEDPSAVWKPTQDDGTYFYTAQYKIDCGSDSQTKNLKGYIQVLR